MSRSHLQHACVSWLGRLVGQCFLAGTLSSAGLAFSATAPNVTGVRTSEPRIADAVASGMERSQTFRTLVAAIAASHGIVYVQYGTCGGGVRACLLGHVTCAGEHRILFVRVAAGQAEVSLIELIGHELQHAVEVLSEPSIVDEASFYFFYKRVGSLGTRVSAFETAAAVEAQRAVRREIRSHRSGRESRRTAVSPP